MFVFRSNSAAAAHRRAEAIAAAMAEERDDVDDGGRRIRWALDHVLDVVPIGPAGLVDGAEVWRDRYA